MATRGESARNTDSLQAYSTRSFNGLESCSHAESHTRGPDHTDNHGYMRNPANNKLHKHAGPSSLNQPESSHNEPTKSHENKGSKSDEHSENQVRTIVYKHAQHNQIIPSTTEIPPKTTESYRNDRNTNNPPAPKPTHQESPRPPKAPPSPQP